MSERDQYDYSGDPMGDPLYRKLGPEQFEDQQAYGRKCIALLEPRIASDEIDTFTKFANAVDEIKESTGDISGSDILAEEIIGMMKNDCDNRPKSEIANDVIPAVYHHYANAVDDIYEGMFYEDDDDFWVDEDYDDDDYDDYG